MRFRLNIMNSVCNFGLYIEIVRYNMDVLDKIDVYICICINKDRSYFLLNMLYEL